MSNEVTSLEARCVIPFGFCFAATSGHDCYCTVRYQLIIRLVRVCTAGAWQRNTSIRHLEIGPSQKEVFRRTRLVSAGQCCPSGCSNCDQQTHKTACDNV